MKTNKLMIPALIAISILFFISLPAYAQQLAILYTGNTQGTILPLFK